MKQSWFTIESNEEIAKDIMKMQLKGDTSAILSPGQFVNIRPISVCDYSDGSLTLIYKIVGHGTEQMSRYVKGTQLDLLSGLGNGYDTAVSGSTPLLIGGGVGVPPLYALCKKLISEGKQPSVILGFNSADEVFFENEFRALGAAVTVTTADGSCGVRGFVTDAMPRTGYSHIFTCGPEPMLKAVFDICKTDGQFSFEERMGCGFGACMGCSCKTKYGSRRICKDGPVLRREEIIW